MRRSCVEPSCGQPSDITKPSLIERRDVVFGVWFVRRGAGAACKHGRCTEQRVEVLAGDLSCEAARPLSGSGSRGCSGFPSVRRVVALALICRWSSGGGGLRGDTHTHTPGDERGRASFNRRVKPHGVTVIFQPAVTFTNTGSL